MIKVAAVAFEVRRNHEANLKKIDEYIKKAAKQNVDLLCFSELSICGFPDSLCSITKVDAKYINEIAELVPEGKSTRLMISYAEKYHLYIEFGLFERDPDRPEFIHNTAVLVGPEGYIGKYRKVHLPGNEIMYVVPGDSYPVFDTKLGRIGMFICYDKNFPEVARILKLKGAQIILAPTAWGCHKKDESDLMLRRYLITNECNAMLNSIPIIDSNAIWPEDPNGFECGNSRILNSRGQTLATTGFEEGMAVADLDLDYEATCNQWEAELGFPTMNFIRDRKPATYGEILNY